MKILIKAADFVVAFLLSLLYDHIHVFAGGIPVCIQFASVLDGRAVPLFLYLYCIHRRSVGRETGNAPGS